MNIVCTICSDLIGKAENIYANKCGHLFHQHCFLQWIERSTTCPQCRDAVTKRTMFRVYPTFNPDATLEDAEALPAQLLEAKLNLQKVLNATTEELELMLRDYTALQYPSILKIATFTTVLKRALRESKAKLTVTSSELAAEREHVVELRERLQASTETIAQLKQRLQQLAKDKLSEEQDEKLARVESERDSEHTNDSAVTSHDDEPRAKRARAGTVAGTGDSPAFDLSMTTAVKSRTLSDLETLVRIAATHSNVSKSRVTFQMTTDDPVAAVELVQQFAKIKKDGEFSYDAPPDPATAKTIPSYRLTQFKTALQQIFRAERASSLPVSQVTAYINKRYSHEAFDSWELHAAFQKMNDENVLMVANDTVFLI